MSDDDEAGPASPDDEGDQASLSFDDVEIDFLTNSFVSRPSPRPASALLLDDEETDFLTNSFVLQSSPRPDSALSPELMNLEPERNYLLTPASQAVEEVITKNDPGSRFEVEVVEKRIQNIFSLWVSQQIYVLPAHLENKKFFNRILDDLMARFGTTDYNEEIKRIEKILNDYNEAMKLQDQLAEAKELAEAARAQELIAEGAREQEKAARATRALLRSKEDLMEKMDEKLDEVFEAFKRLSDKNLKPNVVNMAEVVYELDQLKPKLVKLKRLASFKKTGFMMIMFAAFNRLSDKNLKPIDKLKNPIKVFLKDIATMLFRYPQNDSNEYLRDVARTVGLPTLDLETAAKAEERAVKLAKEATTAAEELGAEAAEAKELAEAARAQELIAEGAQDQEKAAKAAKAQAEAAKEHFKRVVVHINTILKTVIKTQVGNDPTDATKGMTLGWLKKQKYGKKENKLITTYDVATKILKKGKVKKYEIAYDFVRKALERKVKRTDELLKVVKMLNEYKNKLKAENQTLNLEAEQQLEKTIELQNLLAEKTQIEEELLKIQTENGDNAQEIGQYTEEIMSLKRTLQEKEAAIRRLEQEDYERETNFKEQEERLELLQKQSEATKKDFTEKEVNYKIQIESLEESNKQLIDNTDRLRARAAAAEEAQAAAEAQRLEAQEREATQTAAAAEATAAAEQARAQATTAEEAQAAAEEATAAAAAAAEERRSQAEQRAAALLAAAREATAAAEQARAQAQVTAETQRAQAEAQAVAVEARAEAARQEAQAALARVAEEQEAAQQAQAQANAAEAALAAAGARVAQAEQAVQEAQQAQAEAAQAAARALALAGPARRNFGRPSPLAKRLLDDVFQFYLNPALPLKFRMKHRFFMTLEHKGTKIFAGPIYQPEGKYSRRGIPPREMRRIRQYLQNPYESDVGRNKFEHFASIFQRTKHWEWRVTSKGLFRRWVAEVWYPIVNQMWP